MVNAYLVMNLREGDMVSLIAMYKDRGDAYYRLTNLIEEYDSSTSWWKILKVEIPDLPSGVYDVTVRVNWGGSNRVKFISIQPEGTIMSEHPSDRYFTDSVKLV